MQIDLIVKDPRWTPILDTARYVEAIANLSCTLSLEETFEASLLATDDAEVAQLNADFRDKPQPTNVLSWPSQPLAPPAPGVVPPPPTPDPFDDATHLGDIALAYETCAREAQEQGKTLGDHATHLILHGVLHLLGYDHETGQDAAVMEQIETEVLGHLGIEDPYGDPI